jgi:uncharacterized protein YndB with AHSA1/START domain
MTALVTAHPDRFIYVTYIRTTQEKLWDALRLPEFTKLYWFGVTLDCAWEKGASWKMVLPDGRTVDQGSIEDYDPPRRMVIRWRHQANPELAAEGWSRCTMELEPRGDMVKLTVLHDLEQPAAGASKFIAAVSGGWPQILSGLKSLLETGQALPRDGEIARLKETR